MADIAGAFGEMHDLRGATCFADDFFGEILDGDLTTVARIEGAVNVVERGKGEGAYDVFDEDEIARCATITKDRNVLIFQGFFHENWHGSGVCALGILAWAEDIEEAD